MIVNGLEIHSINSKVISIEKVDGELREFLSQKFGNDSGYLIAYLDYGVFMGFYENGELTLPNELEKLEKKYLQKLRLFNKNKELLIWRSVGGLKARLRIDEEGEETYVVDACQVLWGTKAERQEKFTKITEERGTTLIVPVSIDSLDDKKKRLFIRTRNYIGYTPNYQATYIDCRFVKFENSPIQDNQSKGGLENGKS